LSVTGARDEVFQSQINWPKKCTRQTCTYTHTEDSVCVRLLVESALQSHFPWRDTLIIMTCQGGNRKYTEYLFHLIGYSKVKGNIEENCLDLTF